METSRIGIWDELCYKSKTEYKNKKQRLSKWHGERFWLDLRRREHCKTHFSLTSFKATSILQKHNSISNLGFWVWGKEALISKYLSTQLQAMEAEEYVEFPFKAAKQCNSMDRMSQGLKVWDKNEWIINFWGNVHLALCSLHILITKSSEGFIFA